MQYIPRETPHNVNIDRISPLKQFLAILAGLLGLIFTVYLFLGLLVAWIAPHIPPRVETALGDALVSHLFKDEDSVRSLHVQKILEQLMAGLDADDLRLDYRVRVENSDQVNALALPGGTIQIYSGLLAEIENDNELAFVLAHELGHFHNRDHLKGLGRALVMFMISLPLAGADSALSGFMAGNEVLPGTGKGRRPFRGPPGAGRLRRCRRGRGLHAAPGRQRK